MKDVLQPILDKFLPYAKEKMGFDDDPSIYLKKDINNSESIFGKTAYYDPGQRSITLFITGRHPKDVLRSLSHELVHHTQNCRGDFDQIGEMGEGYAQKNPHLRKMEEEAYLVGNMVFRDFEDKMKTKTIYKEFVKGEKIMAPKKNKLIKEELLKDSPSRATKKQVSLEEWKNKELGTLLSESWGFKFDLDSLMEEAEEEDNLEESEKPDFLDVDGDGDKKEPMKKAVKDKKGK